MRTSQAVFAVFSREVGIPASRLALLRLLAVVHPGGAGVVQLAQEMGVDAAFVTRSVQRLAADRLVSVRADPSDGRRKQVSLTAAGIRAFERLHERGHRLEAQVAGEVSAADIENAIRVLGRLRAAIESMRTKGVKGVQP